MNQQRLKELYWYKDGYFVNNKTGRLVKGFSRWSYLFIGIRHKDKITSFSYHRMIWLWHYGVLPPAPRELHHVNGIKWDNRIENLRSVTRAENMMGVGKARILPRGVYQRGNRFYAMLTRNNENRYIGAFNCAEDAQNAVSAWCLLND